MFADPYTAYYDYAGAGTSKTFARQSINGNGTKYICTSSRSAGDPLHLEIAHSKSGKGTSSRQRHLIRLIAPQVVDSVETAVTASLYTVFDLPDIGFSASQRNVILRQLVGILRGGGGDAFNELVAATFLERWVNGES